MAFRDVNRTMFGDLKADAELAYRVQTEQSTYFVALHEERGRRYVIVRGASGSDREHVVVRDSEPRIGDASLFDVPPAEWVGQVLEVATMRTTAIVSVMQISGAAVRGDREAVRVPLPTGVPENPRIAPVAARGTQIGDRARELAQQVVMGQPREHRSAMPYPARHVRYAEDVCALLRSINRRERIFADLAGDRELREKLSRHLDEAERLIAEIKKRR